MGLEIQAILFALIAAVLAAGKVFWLKATDQRLLLYGASNFIGLILALCFIPVVGLPSAAAVPFLITSACLYTVMVCFQLHAFKSLDISLLEPIQRGMRMIFLLIASTVFFEETLRVIDYVGLVCLFTGISFLVDMKMAKMSVKSLAACLVAGLLGGLMTVSDTLGVKSSVSPLNYIVWHLLIGTPTIFMAIALHRKSIAPFFKRNFKNVSMMCLCDTLSYGLVLYILYAMKVSSALPLINIGIIVTALFGLWFLKEKILPKRWAAIAMIVVSIITTQIL